MSKKCEDKERVANDGARGKGLVVGREAKPKDEQDIEKKEMEAKDTLY